jgi:nucleoside 2-deoxyribosyltransferase
MTKTPRIVCICGSMPQKAATDETLAGNIVLTTDRNALSEAIAGKTAEGIEEIRLQVEELHKRKIDLCDEVLVLNVGGHIDYDTYLELKYAEAQGKHICFLEPASARLNV